MKKIVNVLKIRVRQPTVVIVFGQEEIIMVWFPRVLKEESVTDTSAL